MAQLEPGIKIGNAQHFHNARPWADRLRVNSGTVIDAGRFWPRDDWRPLDAEELSLITTAPPEPADCLRLFNIPQRLHGRWWDYAAQDGSAAKGGVTFRQFASEMLEYLQFKQLPLPPACSFEVLVHAIGQPSIRPDLGGLTAEWQSAGILGGINLADEEAALVVLNLGMAQLNQRQPSSSPISFLEQARAFFAAQSDYPLIRIALMPGEGFWLPADPLAVDGDTRGRTEVDVQLQIRKSTANES